MFGAEDWLLNDLASELSGLRHRLTAEWPIKYKLNHGNTRMMPVHVLDVAEALSVMLTAPLTSTASTFALPGPEAYSFNELLNLVEFFTFKKLADKPTVPRFAVEMLAKVLNRAIWWPTINPDEIQRKYIDDLGVEEHLHRADTTLPGGWGGDVARPSPFVGVDGEPAKGFADLKISPDLIEEHAQKYLKRYRSASVISSRCREGSKLTGNRSTYDTPLETGHFKPTKRYHTVP
jgi:NADH dehydrogenase (ubiquinone) 1 alpha subcomplex subunit 9